MDAGMDFSPECATAVRVAPEVMIHILLNNNSWAGNRHDMIPPVCSVPEFRRSVRDGKDVGTDSARHGVADNRRVRRVYAPNRRIRESFVTRADLKRFDRVGNQARPEASQ